MSFKTNKIVCITAICLTMCASTTMAGGGVDLIFADGFEAPGVPELVAFTSFEEPVLQMGVNDGKYFDTGSDTQAHALINNAGETAVNLNVSATELDISASWAPYNSLLNDSFVDEFGNDIIGMTDGDFAGITTFHPPMVDFTEGVQGYQLSDPDGTMTIVSEPVDLSGRTNNTMSLDYYLAAATWEINQPAAGNDIRNDGVRIYAENSVTNDRYYILDTLTDNILTIQDIDDLGIEGVWQNASVVLPDNVIVRLVVEFRAGSASEILWLDNVRFVGAN